MNNIFLKYKLLGLISIVCLVIMLSCDNNEKKVFRIIRDNELKKHDYVNVEIKRYEVDLFKCNIENIDSLGNDLKKLKGKYPGFLNSDLDNEYELAMIEAYLADISVTTLYDATMKEYDDITFLEVQLTDFFKRIKVIMPDFVIPTTYTYVSGGDYETPVKYSNDELIIALDMYLGASYPVYSMWGIPKYITYRMRREQIVVDCAKAIARSYIDKYEIKNKTLLDKMIYEGKILYFSDITLPNIPDSIKIFYNVSEIGWAERYQGNVWAFFIDNQLLYSNDFRKTNKFVSDGPFTSAFSQNSPSRTGHFIGWQIVRQCMSNNPNYEVKEMLQEINSSKILQMSKYKPRKF